MNNSEQEFTFKRIIDSLDEEERKEYEDTLSKLNDFVTDTKTPKNLKKIAQAVINLSNMIYYFDETSEESDEFSLEDVYNQLLIINRKFETTSLKSIKKEEQKNEMPKWWPRTDRKKLKYRGLYSKIKPLYDKGKNFSQIAEELSIDRHEVSHVLIWFSKSPEAYGK